MNNIWLIGTGSMSIEYTKVLNSLDVNFITIGRGTSNALIFEEKTGNKAIIGGLEKYLSLKPEIPSHAIVAVNVEALSETTINLIKAGVKNILVEKPGVCNPYEINELTLVAKQNNSKVFIGYNRRFYSSILKAEEIINNDGGVTSFNFEFTEWSHRIKTIVDGSDRFKRWILSNSTHVIDLAFFLGGSPSDISTYRSGSLSWHSTGSIFAGAGITDKKALFSYQANWESPGRWGIEICTNKHRLYFRPLETLQIQEIGSVSVNPVILNDDIDIQFKPGLFLQTKSFLQNDHSRLCTLDEQKTMIKNIYNKISGY